jgi:protein LSM14
MSSYLIGKKIVLKSNSEIRYTGTLHAIDTNTNSISLVEVTSLGTEDRLPPGQFVPPLDTVYPYVVFR